MLLRPATTNTLLRDKGFMIVFSLDLFEQRRSVESFHFDRDIPLVFRRASPCSAAHML